MEIRFERLNYRVVAAQALSSTVLPLVFEVDLFDDRHGRAGNSKDRRVLITKFGGGSMARKNFEKRDRARGGGNVIYIIH